MGDASDGNGRGTLPVIVWLPISLGAIQLFGMVNTPDTFWSDFAFALAIGAVGLMAARFFGVLPMAVRHAIPQYGGAIAGGIVLDALAGPISFREVLAASAIAGIIHVVVDMLIKSGRSASPALRRRSGPR